MIFQRRNGGRGGAELFGGILNLCVGIVCLAGGLSGAIRLIGTDTGTPLVILGGVLVVVGGLRLWRRWARRRADAQETAEPGDREENDGEAR